MLSLEQLFDQIGKLTKAHPKSGDRVLLGINLRLSKAQRTIFMRRLRHHTEKGKAFPQGECEFFQKQLNQLREEVKRTGLALPQDVQEALEHYCEHGPLGAE